MSFIFSIISSIASCISSGKSLSFFHKMYARDSISCRITVYSSSILSSFSKNTVNKMVAKLQIKNKGKLWPVF